jgi:hypothetical protein
VGGGLKIAGAEAIAGMIVAVMMKSPIVVLDQIATVVLVLIIAVAAITIAIVIDRVENNSDG